MQIAVLCLIPIPRKDFLQKGSKVQLWVNQEGSGSAALVVFVWMGLTS